MTISADKSPRLETTPARPDLADPVQLLAFGFGSGLSKVAPGTFGTAVGVGLHLALIQGPAWLHVGFVLLATLIGSWICAHASRFLGVHDHGGIVWDEIASFLWVGMFLPAGWPWLLAGFLLFRLFDIWKPYPIALLDRRVGGGLGIMLDDLLAAAYAVLFIELIQYLGA